MNDLLSALQTWYARQCNGDWEHSHGVKIESCDNPGWWVKIDVVATNLQARPFDSVAVNIGASGHPQGRRWLTCYVKDDVWHGAGDETKLAEILARFLDWAGEPYQKTKIG